MKSLATNRMVFTCSTLHAATRKSVKQHEVAGITELPSCFLQLGLQLQLFTHHRQILGVGRCQLSKTGEHGYRNGPHVWLRCGNERCHEKQKELNNSSS